MRVFLLLISLMLAYSCIGKESVSVVVLDQSIKKNAKEITGDTIEYDSHIMADEYYIMDDSILIIFNDTHHADCFFEFYNTNNGQLLKRYLFRGNGHNELVNIIAYYNDGYLYVNGFMNNVFVKVDCRQLLTDPLYNPAFVNYTAYTQNLIPFDDESFIYENAYCFSDPSIHVNQDVPRLLLTNKKSGKEKYKYDTYNVTGGIIMLNKPGNRIVYASKRFPFIEIYNTRLEMLKKIKGPDELDVKYHINEKNNEIIFKGVIPQTFMRYAYNKDHFYLAYKGVLSNNPNKNLNTWIFKFNWNGDVIDSYLYRGSIECLSISNDEEYLYVTTHDALGVPALVKIQLNK